MKETKHRVMVSNSRGMFLIVYTTIQVNKVIVTDTGVKYVTVTEDSTEIIEVSAKQTPKEEVINLTKLSHAQRL